MVTMTPPYTRLSTAQLAGEFVTLAEDVWTTLGAIPADQLNWRPSATGWSVAQCVDHLVKSKTEMCRAIDRTLDGTAPRTVWQRLPLWPRLMGWLLITSQSPGGRRKFTAELVARPSTGSYDRDIINRLISDQRDLAARVQALDGVDARRIMVSPFVARITYSVLDGYRLIAAHQRRHFEQAVRVTRASGFPAAADSSCHPRT